MANGTSGTSTQTAGWARARARIHAAAMAKQGQPVTPNGKPVPAITMQQLQSMSDDEFAQYLGGLKNTPIDQNTYYNHDWDTQRLIANMPELNKAPEVLDPKAFQAMRGPAIYRTVNASGGETALDICGRTMSSDVTTIGGGVMGDGFYFHKDKAVSMGAYGNYKNNIKRSATMSAKLNKNAKIVSSDRLDHMLSMEPSSVQQAVRNMYSGGGWGGSAGKMAYALRKGYNVVQRSDGTYNVIDRSAATWSGEVVPVTQ